MRPTIKNNLKNLKPYEPGKPEEAVMREFGLTDIIKLASNESPYPPFDEVLEVIAREASTINRYPDGDYFELKEALSKKLAVDESRLVLGNGSSELIRNLFTVLVEPGDSVVFGHPSFVLYPIYSTIFSARQVVVPMKDYRHDLEAMAAQIDSRTRMVIVCNPNNPTGAYNNARDVIEFVDSIPEEVVIVFDEAYFEYVSAEDFPSTLSDFYDKPNVVVLRTFSKIYSLAGLRVGYGICPGEIASAVNKTKEPFTVDRLADAAAVEALRYPEKIAERKAVNASQRGVLEASLRALCMEPIPSEANFIFVKTPVAGREIFDDLQRKGVIVRPGEALGEPGHIRVTVGTEEQNRVFIDELSNFFGKGDDSR